MAQGPVSATYGDHDICVGVVQNNTGSTIVKGSSVQYDTIIGQIVATSATTARQLGILMADCPNLAYAEIQTGGVAIALAGAGGLTVGQPVTAAVGGTLIAWTATGGTNVNFMGMARTAALATEYFELHMAGVGQLQQG